MMSCRRPSRFQKATFGLIVLFVVLWFMWSREEARKLREKTEKENAEHFDKSLTVVDSKDYETFLLVLVMTGPKNQDRRDVIRKTWLAESVRQKETDTKSRDIMHLFVLGTAGLGDFELTAIKQEQAEHNDLLLLEGFEDAYEKLTEKLGIMLTWVRDHVKFKYIFKGDDDTFARCEALVKELKYRYTYHPDQSLYYGYFYGKGKVKKSGPWKETEWNLCDMYIPYARGGGYILSSHIVEYVANNFHLFKRYLSEDVSLGSWLAPLDITRYHDKRFDTEYKSRGCANNFIVSHKQSIEDMLTKHKNLEKTGKLCEKEFQVFPGYEYNWDVPPSQCCVREKSIP